MNKKVGIITMHKVMNSGSALQTWALWIMIKSLGYDCRIIDYQYPNSFHLVSKDRKNSSISKLKFFYLRLKYFLLYRSKTQKQRFEQFWRESWLETKHYNNREMILRNPPLFDIYVTGSDQVWNPQYTQGDSVFMCGFIKDKIKISYASSFAQCSIPDNLKNYYKEYLKEYVAISVRESYGVDIINRLIGKEAKVVCDPTLLLKKNDYLGLANRSKINITSPYLLAYILNYSYNPYPKIQEVIDRIAKDKNLKVIYLHANSVDNYHLGKSITSAGPCEFLNLFLNASYIVTSSFHGTAFALNFEKPFYAVVPSGIKRDNRIISLLEMVKASQRAIMINQDLSNWVIEEINYSIISPLLEKYRDESITFLEESLIKDYE